MYFEWSDGTPVTYTKWHYGEPAHTWNKADCILMKGKVKIPSPLSCFLVLLSPKRKTFIIKKKKLWWGDLGFRNIESIYGLGLIQDILVWKDTQDQIQEVV